MSSRNLIGKVENIQKYKDPTNRDRHIWDITITDEETGNLEKIRLQGCDPPTPDQGDISRGDKVEAFVSGQDGGFYLAVKLNNWGINKTIQFKPCKEVGGRRWLPTVLMVIGAVVSGTIIALLLAITARSDFIGFLVSSVIISGIMIVGVLYIKKRKSKNN